MKKRTWKRKVMASMLAAAVVISGTPSERILFQVDQLAAATGEETVVFSDDEIEDLEEQGFDVWDDGSLWGYTGTQKEIVIPDGVTFIRGIDNSNVTKVTLSSSVTTIGSYSFSDCENLKTIVINDGLKNIEEGAFSGCSALENIRLNEGLEMLGAYAFSQCIALEEIVLPNSLKRIEYGTFEGCTSLRKVDMGQGVEFIDQEAFYEDQALKEVKFSNSLLEIGTWSFRSTGLETVEFPDSLEMIGQSAFADCEKLTSVKIGKKLREIGQYAFSNDSKLESVDFQCESLQKIGADAFGDCVALKEVVLANCDSIGEGAFWKCENIEKVILGEGVKKIEGDAFYHCTNLKELNIGYGVEFIGDCAFEFCEKIEALDIPSSVSYIGNSAFYGCENVGEVYLPTGIKYLGKCALDGTAWMETKLAEAKRNGDRYIKEGTILLDTLYYIGSEYEDTLTIPNEESGDVTIISSLMTDAEKVTIGDGVISVGGISDCASDEKGGIKEIVFSDSVKCLGANGLWSMPKLQKVTLPAYLEEIPAGLFDYDESLVDVKIPEGVKVIGAYAFERCTSLEELDLPKTLESIGPGAFDEVPKIKELFVPENVTYIGYDAFGNYFEDEGSKDEDYEDSENENTYLKNNMTIVGYEGTLAQQYAEDNNIPFKSAGIIDFFKEETATISSKKKNQLADKTAKDTEGQYKVTLVTDGGSCETDCIYVNNGEKYENLPAVSKANAVFTGWYTQQEGGTKVENTTVVNINSDQTLYAQYMSSAFMIKFDGNGGEIEGISSKSVNAGETYGELPNATMEEYEFVGWYTQRDGGQLITENMVVSGLDGKKETTLYAKWVSKSQSIDFDRVHYSFLNNRSAFGYPNPYKVPYSVFKFLYGDNSKAQELNSIWPKWGGNCFGMVSTAMMLGIEGDGIELTDFDEKYTKNSELSVNSMNAGLQISLTRFIEALHISQVEDEVARNTSNTKNDLGALKEALDNMEKSNGLPIVINIYSSPQSGHAVLAYKSDDTKIYVYDPNYTTKEQYISITRDQKKNIIDWSYKINGSEECGSQIEGSSIAFDNYVTVLRAWEKRNSKCYSNNILVCCNVANYNIKDENGKKIATVKGGNLITDRDDIFMADASKENNPTDECRIYLPAGTYTVENTSTTEEFELSVLGTERSLTANTKSRNVKVVLKDTENASECSVTPEEGENYSIEMDSTAVIDSKSQVVVQGTGDGSEIQIEQNQGAIAFENCENATIKADEKTVSLVDINASAGEGGSISRQGSKSVIKDEDACYAITPDKGYMVDDVQVDGRSVGNVYSYTFSKVAENHKISASFKKANMEAATVTVMDEIVKGSLPKVKVQIGNQILTEKDDYRVYDMGETDTKKNIKIVGLGAYAGTVKTVSFDFGTQAGTVLPGENSGAVTGEPTQQPQVSATPAATATPAPGEAVTATGDSVKQNGSKVNAGDKVEFGVLQYKVTNTTSKTVSAYKSIGSAKTVTIPATIKVNGETYKVTAVGAKLLMNDSFIKKLVIGKNVKSIGTKAFFGTKKLKNIVIQTGQLKKVGAKAFTGTYKKVIVKVPSGKKAKYKKLLKKKGLSAKAKIK